MKRGLEPIASSTLMVGWRVGEDESRQYSDSTEMSGEMSEEEEGTCTREFLSVIKLGSGEEAVSVDFFRNGFS
jgi:hypothetical protein